MSDPKRAYMCGSCEEVHDLEHYAEECCRPEVWEVWLCPHCDNEHELKDDAKECCGNKKDISCPTCLRPAEGINYEAIQMKGCCSYCSPSAFGCEDKITIEALYEQRTGAYASLDAGI